MYDFKEAAAKEAESSVPEPDGIDSELSSELDRCYEDLLKGKSKEELLAMRERLLKLKEMFDGNPDDASEGDQSPHELILKQIHRR